MNIPAWLKPGIWGAVAGVAVTAIVGFTQLGWMTSGTAERIALNRSETAVITALVPLCMDKARLDPNVATMVKLKGEQSSYSRSDIVLKAGWATLGGTTGSDSLARACSEKLYEQKTS